MAFTLQLNAKGPDFDLPGVDGKRYSLGSFKNSKILIIVFSCNHCPFVIGSEDRMNKLFADYSPKGVTMVAINSNEAEGHPTDSFEHMVQRAKDKNFRFPYVRDDSQQVAVAYGALRTPHFYVFDAGRRLVYTGRGVDSPRDASRVTVNDLADALEDHLAGRPVRRPKTNPIGCNVKWDGQDQHWMPADACDLV